MAISSVKPYTMSLMKFYGEESNLIFIPSIQREFVWDVDQVKELVESIINNYPIGSIILWETDEPVPSSKLYDIGKEPKNTESARKYVIDGQQRLTSLILIKNRWKIERDGKPIETDSIRYIPETKSFTISNRRGIDLSDIVDASLANPDALTYLQNNFPKEFQDAIQNVGRRILNYEIPFYAIKTNSEANNDIYEKIADIFTRVNSSGTQIGNLEMFLSFFAAAFPKGQKERLMNFHDEMNKKHGIDLEPIIRFIFSELEMTQYQITRVKSFKNALQEIKERFEDNLEELDLVINRCFKALEIVLDMLANELGFTSTKYLPSQNILIPIFDFVYRSNIKDSSALKETELKNIKYWLLTGSFHGLYSGSPTTKLVQDLKVTNASKGTFPYKRMMLNMKKTINISKIRREDIQRGMETSVSKSKNFLMLLFALLYSKGATNWAGALINFDNVTVHHIFPREYLIENSVDEPEKINSLGNLTFIDQSANSSIGVSPPDQYLKDYDRNVLFTHLIPTDKELWKLKNYTRFLKERSVLIWNELKLFQP